MTPHEIQVTRQRHEALRCWSERRQDALRELIEADAAELRNIERTGDLPDLPDEELRRLPEFVRCASKLQAAQKRVSAAWADLREAMQEYERAEARFQA